MIVRAEAIIEYLDRGDRGASSATRATHLTSVPIALTHSQLHALRGGELLASPLSASINLKLQDGDTNVLIPWMLIAVVAVILANLVADVLYAALDPRVRLTSGSPT